MRVMVIVKATKNSENGVMLAQEDRLRGEVERQRGK